jgi:hypothetical protein
MCEPILRKSGGRVGIVTTPEGRFLIRQGFTAGEIAGGLKVAEKIL